MSLPVLVGVVSFGIVLVVFLVHISGGSRRLVIADEAMAAALFGADHEGAGVARAYLTADRHDAVLVLADGGIGLVHAMGSKAVTRRFGRGEGPDATAAGDETSVAIRFHDIAMADIRLTFADRASRDAVTAALGRRPGPAQSMTMEIA